MNWFELYTHCLIAVNKSRKLREMLLCIISRECVRNLDLRVQSVQHMPENSGSENPIVLRASKSAGAKGDVLKIYGFVHLLHLCYSVLWIVKMLKFLNQCFARLGFWKSVSSKTAVAPSSRFRESETLFQNRSCAKHWFKNLNILEKLIKKKILKWKKILLAV